MKSVFLFFILCCGLDAASQITHVGIRAGLSRNEVVTKGLFPKQESRYGLNAGLTYDYTFRNNVSIGAGIVYQERGFDHYVVFSSAFTSGSSTKITHRFDYLGLPITASYKYGKRIYAFANAGIVPAYALNASYTIPENKTAGFESPADEQHITSSITRFDLSGIGEIGAGFQFAGAHCLYLSLAY